MQLLQGLGSSPAVQRAYPARSGVALGSCPGAPTFADVLVLQPELPLDLPVGVPDGAGLLEAVHGLLDVVVAKLVQQRHEVPTGGGPIQRVERVAEGWGGDGGRCPDPCGRRAPWALQTSQAPSPPPTRRCCVPSPPLFAPLTLGDGQLVEPDVVHDGLHLPVLQERVPGHLAEVHHPCQREDTALSTAQHHCQVWVQWVQCLAPCPALRTQQGGKEAWKGPALITSPPSAAPWQLKSWL